MDNLFGMLLNGFRNGNNPMQMLSGMMQSNPAVSGLMRVVQGKNPQQLEQTARNMYREAGMDIDDIARRIGIK